MTATPWIRVDVDMPDNDKLLGLSSDAARWAVIVAMTKAKTRSPQGQFATRAILEHLMAAAAVHIDELIAAGILETAPAICKKCRAAVGRVKAGTVLIHDFGKHQVSSTERVREWRERNGNLNGHETLSERGGNGFPAVTPEVSPVVSQALPSRALSRSRSKTVNTSNEEGGSGGGNRDDPLPIVQAWLASRKVNVAAGTKVHTDLARLVDVDGAPAVISAMEGLPQPLFDGAQYVYGARNLLHPIPSGRPTSGPSAQAAHAADGDQTRRAVEATKRRRAKLESVGEIAGTLADLGVPRLGGST